MHSALQEEYCGLIIIMIMIIIRKTESGNLNPYVYQGKDCIYLKLIDAIL